MRNGNNHTASNMAVSTTSEVANPDHSFLDKSYLTYLVPSATDLQVDEAFKTDGAGKSPIDGLEQREWLFFGMTPLRDMQRAVVSQAHS